MSARKPWSLRSSVKNLWTVSRTVNQLHYFFSKPANLHLPIFLSFAENNQFYKTGGSVIDIMDKLAKEVETEKMKVSV